MYGKESNDEILRTMFRPGAYHRKSDFEPLDVYYKEIKDSIQMIEDFIAGRATRIRRKKDKKAIEKEQTKEDSNKDNIKLLTDRDILKEIERLAETIPKLFHSLAQQSGGFQGSKDYLKEANFIVFDRLVFLVSNLDIDDKDDLKYFCLASRQYIAKFQTIANSCIREAERQGTKVNVSLESAMLGSNAAAAEQGGRSIWSRLFRKRGQPNSMKPFNLGD